jgi:Spy/CpxP family protein refolding chaperone
MKMKFLGVSTLCLGLAFTAAAQRGPRGGFGGPDGNGSLARLGAALDLNEAQIVAAEALQETRQAATEAVRDQLEAHRATLDALLESRDATAIGNAVLAQHDLRTQIQQINAQFQTDFNNLLTFTQQEQFASIQEMMGGRGAGRGGAPEGFSPRGGRGARGPAPE